MMSAARFRQIAQGQTAIAMKVYEALPIEAPMGLHHIRSEMLRLGLNPPNLDVLQGCLKALVDGGLARERPAGLWARLAVKIGEDRPERPALHAVAPPQQPKEEPMPTTPAAPAPKPLSAIDLLAPLSQRVRTLHDVLAHAATQAKEIAEGIEDVAAQLEESATGSTEEIEKLRQLKALLKVLS